MNAVVVAAGAPYCATGAEQCTADAIHTQMAAALALATLGAGGLADVAGFIATGRAVADVFGAGALATGPTEMAARFAVLASTLGTGVETTGSTKDLQTSLTLDAALLTDDVAVAAEHQRRDRLVTASTGRRAQRSGVAVALHFNGHFLLAITQADLGLGHGYVEDGVAEKPHLYAQPVVFHLLGNLAL